MSGSQGQMGTEVVRKRGRPRKNPIVPASPVSSITSSSTDAKSPVYNIHIHLHSPSGVNSNLLSKIQPIVHLHLDKGTQDSSSNVTPPPATRRRSYKKRANSPSLTLISTKKKRKGKNDSCCGSEDSETSLNGFNPIYMSTQRKNSGDNLTRCENACDKNNVLEVDEMCNTGELIDSDNEVPETNIPVDKTGKTRTTPRKKQTKDVQSDSSSSLVSHKCLRYIMPTTTGRANEDPSPGKSICAKSRDENVFKLKEAVVQLRDLCCSKNIMNNLSGGRVTNVSSLVLKDMALRRNPKRTCVRNGSGKKIQWSSESDSASTKSRRSSRIRAPKSVSDEAKVNGNRLIIGSGDDEMSNNSDSETNSQTSMLERVDETGKIENRESTQTDEDDEEMTSLNTSRKNGNMYSMVYTPEKNTPKKRVVLGRKATAVIDKLNFSQIKTRLRARERRDVTIVSCVDSSSIATDTEERLSPAELTSCDENSEAKRDDVTQDGTKTVNGQIDRSSEQVIEKETDSLVETVTKDNILNVGSPVNDPVLSPNKSNSKSVEESQSKEISDSEVEKSSVVPGSVNGQSKKDFPSKASVSAEDSSESERAESDKSDSESDGESSLSEEEKRRNAEIGRSHFFSPENFDKIAAEAVSNKKMTEEVRDVPDEEEESFFDAGYIESESNSEKAEPLSHERSRIFKQVEKEVHSENTVKSVETSVEDSRGEEHGVEKAEENVENAKRDPAVTPMKKVKKTDVPKCVGSENGMVSSDSDTQFKVDRRLRRKKRTLKESREKSRASENELSSESEEGNENEKSDESEMSTGIRDEPEKRNSKERDKSSDKQVSVDEEGSEIDSRLSVEKVNHEEIVGSDKGSAKKGVNELSTPAKDEGVFGNKKSTSAINGSSSEDEVVQEIDDFNDIDEAMVNNVKDKARRRAADETSSEDEEEKENKTEEDDEGEEIVESEASEDSGDVIGCSQMKLINHKKKVRDEVSEERTCDDEERIGISKKIFKDQTKEKEEMIKTTSENNQKISSKKIKNSRKGLRSRNRIEDDRKSEESENEDDVSADKTNAKDSENESESSKKVDVHSEDDYNGGLSEEEGRDRAEENQDDEKECDKERMNVNVNEVEAQTVRDNEEEVEHQEKCCVTNNRDEEDNDKTRKSEESNEKSEVSVPDSKDHREIDEKENDDGRNTFGCNGFLDTEDDSEEEEMDHEVMRIIEFLNKTEDIVKNKELKSVKGNDDDDDDDDVESTLDALKEASNDKDLACTVDDVICDDMSDFKSMESSKRSKGKKKKKKKDRMELLTKERKDSDDEKVEKCKKDKKEKKKKKKRKERHRDDRPGCEEEKTNLIDSSDNYERSEEITTGESKKERNRVDDERIEEEAEKMSETEVVEGLMTTLRTCDSSDNESSCHSGEGRLVIALESDKESIVNNDNNENDVDDVDDDDEAQKRKKKKKKKKNKKEKRRENEDLSGGKRVCEPSVGAVANGEIQRSLDKSKGKTLREFLSHTTSDKDKEYIPDGEEVKMGLKMKKKVKAMAKMNKSPIKRKEPPSEFHASPVPVKKAKKNKKKTNKESGPKKPEKTAKKKYFDEEDYISLNVAGPTKFALAQVDKLKSYEKHDATTYRDRMLFGDRVKRFASKKAYEIYKMKNEAAKRCSS